jgi:hypothetical protein
MLENYFGETTEVGFGHVITFYLGNRHPYGDQWLDLALTRFLCIR